ncbi:MULTISPECIES: nucleotidyltransferase family protein [unclassified Meridianimarinicoccus]|uniref:nucleotidyltransferase family protein n=1 Tax=unclassified Meridianimarinicoccus TaxID=2923344 RepID=UPI001866411B|nr:nucleotidyltransferase family protein [Fluviibacterium sp. MJW13]
MRNRPDAVMLFAAGFGTRMAPLTDTRPKPLIEVAGRSLLDHALALTEVAGVARTVVNAHYKTEMIAAHLDGRGVTVLPEMPEILDTGGGLRNALPHLGLGPVFTMNTDAVWTGPNPLETLRAAWEPSRMSALLCLVPAARATGHKGVGDFSRAPDGQLTRGAEYVYSGVQILDPAGLSDIPDRVFSLNLLWNRYGAEGRLFGVVHRGGWCDVGYPQAIPLAEAMLAAPPQVLP